jgi:nucleotide-binding universal stress UspA family protein
MYRFKKILVGLGWDNSDPALVNYACQLAGLSEAESLCFFHVCPTSEMPPHILETHTDLTAHQTRCDLKSMRDKVEPHLKAVKGLQIEYQVTEQGAVLPEILRAVKQRDIDLLILGHIHRDGAKGTLCERLVRKAPCSVLVFPENSPSTISKVLVALDYSKFSANALDVGTNLVRAARLQGLATTHNFGLTLEHHFTGKTREDAHRILEQEARNDYQIFLNDFQVSDLKFRDHYTMDSDPGRAILQIATEECSDLILAGSRGRTAATALLIGSVTEYLVQHSRIALLAVKEKGVGMSLIDTLFGFSNKD